MDEKQMEDIASREENEKKYLPQIKGQRRLQKVLNK